MGFKLFKNNKEFNKEQIINSNRSKVELFSYKKRLEEEQKNNYAIAYVGTYNGKKTIQDIEDIFEPDIQLGEKNTGTRYSINNLSYEFNNYIKLFSDISYQYNFMAFKIKPYVIVNKAYAKNVCGEEIKTEDLYQYVNHDYAVIDININMNYTGMIKSNDLKDRLSMLDVSENLDVSGNKKYPYWFRNAYTYCFKNIVNIKNFCDVINELGYEIINVSNPECKITADNFVDMLIKNEPNDINICVDFREKQKEKEFV